MNFLTIENLSKRYSRKENFAVKEVSLNINKGEILALVGESGCGKTTLLRLIAGLEIPDAGSLLIDGKIMVDTQTFIKPEKRKIGMVFQDYALFPHLSVKQNVAYGLNKLPKEKREEQINKYLSLVGLLDFKDRYPHELSGGQQQRVALARSLATEPLLILLDEPFSNLDGILKKQMREDVKNIISATGTTAVFVTHDTHDALAIADKIAVLGKGQLLQFDTAENIYRRPVSAYIAAMFGTTNIINGKKTEAGIETEIGFLSVPALNGDCRQVILSIRPNAFVIVDNQQNALVAKAKDVIFAGDHKEIGAEINSRKIIISVSAESAIKTGDTFFVKVNPEKIRFIENE